MSAEPDALIGATAGGGQFRIDRVRARSAATAALEGQDVRLGGRVLLALTAGQTLTDEEHRASLSYVAPAVAPLRFVGRMDPPAAHNVLVEQRPAGEPSQRLTLSPFEATRLARDLIDCIAALGEQRTHVASWRPEHVFAVAGEDGQRLSGVAPRADVFFAHVPAQSVGVINPFPGIYLAPEVLQGAPASEASDVFAVAGLLWYWRFGSPPFSGSNLGEVIVSILSGRRDARPIEGELGPLVDSCFSVEPSDRPALNELVAALDSVVERLRS